MKYTMRITNIVFLLLSAEDSLEIGFTLRKSPLAPLFQRGDPDASLWQREVRRDFLNRYSFNFEVLDKFACRYRR